LFKQPFSFFLLETLTGRHLEVGVKRKFGRTGYTMSSQSSLSKGNVRGFSNYIKQSKLLKGCCTCLSGCFLVGLSLKKVESTSKVHKSVQLSPQVRTLHKLSMVKDIKTGRNKS